MDMIIDFPGGSRVDAHFNGFTVSTDQPPVASAPSPFDHFLASIGTCAGIYVLGFCQQRSLPTEGLRIVERITRNPLSHMVENISLDIQLLLGLVLYFVSSYGIKALSQGMNFLSDPAYAQYRFFSMEHTAYMLLAVVFATLGSLLPRKRQEADHKFMRAAISFTIVFILIIYGIPWWRPLLRILGFEIP